MNSNGNYSQFIEHSFRRLTLLIHEQDEHTRSTPSITNNKINEQLSINKKKSNLNDYEFRSCPSKIKSHRETINDNLSDSIESKDKIEVISKPHRTYMRPPKNRATISYRCASSELSDRCESSLNYTLNSSYSPPMNQQESNELPIHIPCERTLYDIRFERDRQNDLREKYNIPPPFQRKWLRQPRYVPQERPIIGQVQQSKNK